MGYLEEHGLEVDRILLAVVTGGNVLLERRGGQKRRRNVPRAQETLIRLLAECGKADLDALTGAFARQWKRISRRNRGRYILHARREFFRNCADIAARINAQLLAGYSEEATRERMLSLTGSRFLGIEPEHVTFTMRWIMEESFEECRERAPVAEGKSHASLTGRRRNSEEDAGGPEVLSPPPPPAAPESGQEAPESTTPGPPPRTVAAPMLPDREPSPSGPEPQASPAPHSESGEIPSEAADVLEGFTEDPLTGAWRFVLDGSRVEVRRDIGYVTVEGIPVRADFVRDLAGAGDLSGEALRRLRTLVDRVRQGQGEG